MSAYCYLNSGSPITFQSSSEAMLFDFQSMLYSQYNLVPGAYSVQEETVFGSGIFNNVDVRINHVVQSSLGKNLGDDWKQLLFVDLFHATGIGYLYQFDSNYWISVFSENIKNFAGSCTVRRANNNLRWIDEDGNYYSEPCIIDYTMSRPKEDLGATNPMLPEGYISIFAQLNDRTATIKGNQRFLFGPPSNRTCLRTFSRGITNFLNQETDDDSSGQLLELSVGGWEINEQTDDLVNGIADGLKYQYTISASPTSIMGNVGTSIQIIPSLTLNNNPSNKPLSYSTSSSYVATVSASGLVTLISSASSTGSMCNISCYMTNNTSASVIIPVSVITLPYTITEIITTPNIAYVLEGSSTVFNTQLFINGIPQANTFIFTTSGSPIIPTNYIFTTIDGNNFNIENIHRYLDSELTVTLTSGSYISTIPILLKGAY